jgi:hypothetical protein
VRRRHDKQRLAPGPGFAHHLVPEVRRARLVQDIAEKALVFDNGDLHRARNLAAAPRKVKLSSYRKAGKGALQ